MSKKNAKELEQKKEKKSVRTAAVIDIGSNALRLTIGEYAKSKIVIKDELVFPLAIGRDTFTFGKIGFQKVDKICEKLNNFTRSMKEYDVSEYKLIATTAVREALNRDYIIDRIGTRTGMSVDVIDDWGEKNIVYKMMGRFIKDSGNYDGTGLMVFIGSGNLGVAANQNGKISFLQNIHIGTLRLTEILEKLENHTDDFCTLVEEYLNSFTSSLNFSIKKSEMKHFFASGREISLIASLCGAKDDSNCLVLSKESFYNFYEMVNTMTVDQLVAEFSISEDRAEVLLPALCLYKMVFETTSADSFIIPKETIIDQLIYEMLLPEKAAILNKKYEANAIYSAENLASNYQTDLKHSKKVERFALYIFDKMKKIHNCGEREGLLLQIAAILHDIGKFISIRNHHEHSFYVISESDIIGLSKKEIRLVALISKYHANVVPSLRDESYKSLSVSDRVLVSKLSAILRIADALDRGHTIKFDDVDIKFIDNSMVVYVSTYKNTRIEEWAFSEKSIFFKEVFGMDVSIKNKR